MKKKAVASKSAEFRKNVVIHKNDKALLDRSLKKLQYEFLNSTSHQLRTPIASVQSSLDVLELYIKKENTVRQLQVIDKIKKSISGLNNTLERITTLYKNEIVRQKLKLSKIEANKFLNEILDEVLALSGEECFISTNIDLKKKYFRADEFVLKQIVLNLLNNAVKFSPDSGQVRIDISSEKDFVKISIKDEGIGIGKTDLKKLYSPFFRGTNTAQIPGDGLGLSIVKNLCLLHKIKINCLSELSKGTEFILLIPQKYSK